MSDFYILDANGEPVPCSDVITWGKWMQTAERHIGREHLAFAEVSTVFLGVDHAFAGGPPLLYETMVFGGPLDGEQRRYTTRAQAEHGHGEMVERVRNSVH